MVRVLTFWFREWETWRERRLITLWDTLKQRGMVESGKYVAFACRCGKVRFYRLLHKTALFLVSWCRMSGIPINPHWFMLGMCTAGYMAMGTRRWVPGHPPPMTPRPHPGTTRPCAVHVPLWGPLQQARVPFGYLIVLFPMYRSQYSGLMYRSLCTSL